MHTINRFAITINPKQPFVDWVNSTPGEEVFTLKDVREENSVYLVPEYDHEDAVLVYLEKHFDQIFEWELFGWHTDEDDWPQNRTWGKFQTWFEIEIQSEVFDLVDEDIEKEEIWVEMSYPDSSKHRKGFNPLYYPDLHFKYSLKVRPEGKAFRIKARTNAIKGGNEITFFTA